MTQLAGQTIDRFQIGALLYEDRHASVFKANDPKFERAVVIYLIDTQGDQADYFLQAVRTILSWRHPGLARLYDFGNFQDRVYAVQEFIPGPNLAQILQEMRRSDCWISLVESVQLVREVSIAVDYVHQRGLVHGDLHPGSLLFKPESLESLPYQPVLLRTGLVKPGMDTSQPAYRAPETSRGGKFERPADIYALGAILYELCTGQPPTPQNAVSSGPAQVLPPHLLHPDMPEWLEKVILKALSPDPQDRFADAGEMASALNQAASFFSGAKSSPSGISRVCQLLPFYEKGLVEPARTEPLKTSTLPIPISPIPSVDTSQDMVYVLMPDKTVRSFNMKAGGLTIGRGKENDILLDLPGVSRQHARIDFDGQNYIVRDLNSLNGTFSEQKRLPAQKPQIWLPGENLRIGDAWLRVERVAQVRTTQAVVSRDLPTTPGPNRTLPDTDEVFIGPNGESIDGSNILRSPGLGWVGAFTESLSLSVAPGASLEIPILLFNRGPANDTFQINVQGLPSEWMPKPPAGMRVPANAQREVRIAVRPPRSPLVKAGRYAVLVRVASQNSSNQFVELRLTVTVTAFSLFASELRPGTIRSSEMGQVFIHNRGNLPETFTVIWEDRSHSLVFDPTQVKVNLQVGKSAVIEFRPTLKQPRLTGQEASYPFKTHISSQGGQTMSHDGEFLSRGIFPSWAPAALIGLVVLLACVVCLLINQVTFPVRRAERTAQAGWTQVAGSTQTSVYYRTATSQSLEGANQATLQAATATAVWLGLDSDQDGLTNNLELVAGTFPDVADSDQDGLTDGVEVHTWKTNPLVADTDGDGLKDGVEVERGTNPLNRDTDGDGIEDAIDPDPLNFPTRTPFVFFPTSTGRPFFTRTPTPTSTPPRTNTPTLSPTPRFIDLAIQISNGQASSIPGTNTIYTIVVTNRGPAGAGSAQVIDQFPNTLSNITWTCSASPGSRCQTSNGSGNINAIVDLAVNGTATFNASANIAPNATGQLANTARIVTPPGLTEINPLDNQATDTDNLTPHAAISLNKTDNRDSILPGEPITYNIIVFNNGPSRVNGISVQDTFPAQLANATWSCGATSGSSCAASGPQSGNINSQVSLRPGGTATFTVSANVRSNAVGTISNSVSIVSPVDPGSNNKTVTDTTNIIPQANLVVNVSAPLTVTASTPLTYTITVTNTGPSPASGITLTDTLTNTATFISSSPGAPDCQESGGVVVCNLGSLAPGATRQILILVNAPGTGGPFPNVVDIKGNEVDPNPANNRETTIVTAT